MVKLLKPKTQVRIARRWFKRIGIVLLLSCSLATVFYLLFKSDFLVIKNVNCWVQDKTSLADEKRWCEEAERLLLGKRMVGSNLTTVVVNLEHKFLPIGEVVVKKKYPQTVLVQIAERKPIAKVCPPEGREFLVDKEGVLYSEVYPEVQTLSRAVLELGMDLNLGQKLEPEIVSLLLLEEPKISLVKYIGQQGIEAKTNKQLTIFLSREKNLENQIRALQMIVQKYKIEGKDLRQIDLRFDQPIVKY